MQTNPPIRRASLPVLTLAAAVAALLWATIPTNAMAAARPAAASAASAAFAAPATIPVGDVVYATKSGKKYHSPSCASGKNGSPLSEDDAKAKGLEPCTKCGGTPGPARKDDGDSGKPADPPSPPKDPASPPKGAEPGAGGKTPPADPPADSSAVVYATKSGKKYHSPSCAAGKSGSPLSEDDAKAKGLEPCGKCGGKPGPARPAEP